MESGDKANVNIQTRNNKERNPSEIWPQFSDSRPASATVTAHNALRVSLDSLEAVCELHSGKVREKNSFRMSEHHRRIDKNYKKKTKSSPNERPNRHIKHFFLSLVWIKSVQLPADSYSLTTVVTY